MSRVLLAVPLIAMLGAAAPAEELCLAGLYRLPPIIGDDIRPYLVCGLLQGRDGHFAVRLNGQSVSMRGEGPGLCDRIRASAMAASEARLIATMPDDGARRSFVAGEFEKADRFLRTAARSEDLGIGEEPAAPRCRDSNARDR